MSLERIVPTPPNSTIMNSNQWYDDDVPNCFRFPTNFVGQEPAFGVEQNHAYSNPILLEHAHDVVNVYKSNDVLLGRGKSNLLHPGNIAYRAFLGENLPFYREATSRADKIHFMSLALQNVTKNGVRFLKRCLHQQDQWEILSKQEIKDKLAHAFLYLHKIHSTVLCHLHPGTLDSGLRPPKPSSKRRKSQTKHTKIRDIVESSSRTAQQKDALERRSSNKEDTDTLLTSNLPDGALTDSELASLWKNLEGVDRCFSADPFYAMVQDDKKEGAGVMPVPPLVPQQLSHTIVVAPNGAFRNPNNTIPCTNEGMWPPHHYQTTTLHPPLEPIPAIGTVPTASHYSFQSRPLCTQVVPPYYRSSPSTIHGGGGGVAAGRTTDGFVAPAPQPQLPPSAFHPPTSTIPCTNTDGGSWSHQQKTATMIDALSWEPIPVSTATGHQSLIPLADTHPPFRHGATTAAVVAGVGHSSNVGVGAATFIANKNNNCGGQFYTGGTTVTEYPPPPTCKASPTSVCTTVSPAFLPHNHHTHTHTAAAAVFDAGGTVVPPMPQPPFSWESRVGVTSSTTTTRSRHHGSVPSHPPPPPIRMPTSSPPPPPFLLDGRGVTAATGRVGVEPGCSWPDPNHCTETGTAAACWHNCNSYHHIQQQQQQHLHSPTPPVFPPL